MGAYILVEVAVDDHEVFERFKTGIPEVIKKYGGRFVLRSNKVTTVVGEWKPDRISLMEFNSVEELRKCFNSEEYKELAVYREKSAITHAMIIED